MKHTRLTREAAQAVLSTELPAAYVRPLHADTLVAVAKGLQRLQAKRAKLRRQLKAVDQDIKHARRELKALCQDISKGRDQ